MMLDVKLVATRLWELTCDLSLPVYHQDITFFVNLHLINGGKIVTDADGYVE